jgi:protein tyrosine phosphatase (PTP) superfamily phosphohydrolase (DUF442 family)
MLMQRFVRKVCRFSIAAIFSATAFSATLAQQTSVSSQPSATHGIARKLSVSGLPNLGEVTPTLYRGAQPTADGFDKLAKMGVEIVVDLRGDRKDERDMVTKLGMRYVPIPWFCMRPKDADIARFLGLLRESRDKKVFVHCNTGIDRTGMMIASYRITEQGWTAEEAMTEMKEFGFSLFHETICPGLYSYEQRFPHELASDPSFENLRTIKRPPPAPGEQPQR